jgi:hypothetical protein
MTPRTDTVTQACKGFFLFSSPNKAINDCANDYRCVVVDVVSGLIDVCLCFYVFLANFPYFEKMKI